VKRLRSYRRRNKEKKSEVKRVDDCDKVKFGHLKAEKPKNEKSLRCQMCSHQRNWQMIGIFQVFHKVHVPDKTINC
jgi:hypothetical protein